MAGQVERWKKYSNRLLEIEYVTLCAYLELVFHISDQLNSFSVKTFYPLACKEKMKHQGWLYLACAVSDYYIPRDKMEQHKIQSGETIGLQLNFYDTPKCMGKWLQTFSNLQIVSFKLETDDKVLEEKVDRSFQKYGTGYIIGNILNTRYKEVLCCRKLGDGKGGKGTGWDSKKVLLNELPKDSTCIEQGIINYLLEDIAELKKNCGFR